MNTVEIDELQKHLTSYLARVKRGQEFAVEEDDKIIARILPFEAENGLSENEKKLVAEGLMRLPVQEEADEDFREEDLPEIDPEIIFETIRRERDEE